MKTDFTSMEEELIENENIPLTSLFKEITREIPSFHLISVIIPLYNEEKTIKNIIERIPDHQKYEIIIVNDGSTDKSLEKVKEVTDRHIKIIEHEVNQGYGAAVLSGLSHATGDIVVTLDSDGQHNPEEIPYLVKPILNNRADITVGSRYLGKSNYKVPIYTRLGEYFVSTWLKMLFKQSVCNNQSGFRAFNSNSLRIFKSLKHTTFGFCTETLFEAAYNKLRICEVPILVNIRKYGTSHIKLFRILIAICSCILTYLVKRFKLNRFIPGRILAKIKNQIKLVIKKFT
ncbi:MAG: glycosyltransferase family 2 protein [Candidatus Thorarchaeota archaeon]